MGFDSDIVHFLNLVHGHMVLVSIWPSCRNRHFGQMCLARDAIGDDIFSLLDFFY